jgi:hypothetical protein
LPEGYGCESKERLFQGGTIYNDAALSLIWVENQVSLGANEMVMGKACFEQWLWDMAYAKVKHHHGNNGIFPAEEYHHECTNRGQSQSFSGIRVHIKCLGQACYSNNNVHGLVVALWCTHPCIGQIEGWMTSLYGLLQ